MSDDALRPFRQGNGALKAKDYPKAIRLYSQAIEVDPTFAEAWNNRGAAHRLRYDDEAALSDYSQAIRLDPKHPRAWLNRASVRVRMNRLDEAWADLDQAERVGTKDTATIYAKRGVICIKRGEIARSYRYLWDGVCTDPDQAWIQEELTKNLSKIVTIQMLRSAEARIAANPDDKEAHFDRGYILCQRGARAEGMAALEKAIEIDPQFALPHLQIGYYLSRSGQAEAAIPHFNSALMYDTSGPIGTLARWCRANAAHAINRNNMAASDIAVAVQRMPRAYQILAETARAEYRAGRYDSALRYLDRALETRPADPWATDFQAKIRSRAASQAHGTS